MHEANTVKKYTPAKQAVPSIALAGCLPFGKQPIKGAITPFESQKKTKKKHVANRSTTS
jgi:hypothetical protein